jgi:protein SCO1/2
MVVMLVAQLPERGPARLPSVAVHDDQGRAIQLESLIGVPLLLTMGYSACKTRCPLTLGKLKRVEAAFRAAGRAVRLVVVTLDPHNDSVEKLRSVKAAQGLGEQWHLLTANDAQTQQLISELGLKVARDDEHIDHEARVFLFDARGALVHSYTGWKFDPTDPVTLTEPERTSP